jgi:hypothetical protein
VVGLLGFGLILPSLAANGANGEINGLFASKINQWFGAFMAQIGNAAQGQTGRAVYSCECRYNIGGGETITLSKKGVSTLSCKETEAVISSPCQRLCESQDAEWTKKHSCFDINLQDQSYYPIPSNPDNPAQYFPYIAAKPSKLYQGEYSCLCGKDSINTWKTGKTECGEYATDPYAIDPMFDCPNLCVKNGMEWTHYPDKSKKDFEYKVVKCETTPSPSIASAPKPWSEMTVEEKKLIQQQIYSERRLLSRTKFGLLPSYRNGVVTLSWNVENANQCWVRLEGSTAKGGQSSSGSLTFPVTELLGKTQRLRYDIRCFTVTEVRYGKTSTANGSARIGYIRIPEKSAPTQKTWSQMNWTERGLVMNRIKSERELLKIKTAAASYDVNSGMVTLTWQAENASQCRVWLQGFAAKDKQLASGSVSLPVARIRGNTKTLNYNVRCFTVTEVRYGKTGIGTTYGKQEGGSVKIPAQRGGI